MDNSVDWVCAILLIAVLVMAMALAHDRGEHVGIEHMWQQAYERGYAETYVDEDENGKPAFRWVGDKKKGK